MSSYQRVALFVFFDSLERDLIDRIRNSPFPASMLTEDERSKAVLRLERREGVIVDKGDDNSLLPGLDLGEKYQVLMRYKVHLDTASSIYYASIHNQLERSIPTRNAVMHGRPLTTTEYALGFSLANDFVKCPIFWPYLAETFENYSRDPEQFLRSSITLLDDEPSGETLHNLPVPDYEDTGFLPRPDLERDLRKKILGRHPVITVLGEGGNGKTALTLQTLYGLIASNDHDFDAIIWTSAKSSRLGLKEVEKIEGAITNSLGIINEIAGFEPGSEAPLERVQRLLAENKVLLVIDNLETVLDDDLRKFALDIPGESKLVLTSRVPLGSDLSIHVTDFDEMEARQYLRRLADAYTIAPLKSRSNDQLDRYARRLNRKPLLLKWFALGTSSGLDPDRITAHPELALKFCMENVIDRLSKEAKTVAGALSLLPTGLSAPLLQEVTALGGLEIESGIAELLRFALIQRDEKLTTERQYQIGMSAKSYISRVLPQDTDFSNEVLRRYRSIGATYQLEKGNQATSKYDPRYFFVRSRSEALMSRKLKEVMRLISKDALASAEDVISEVRMLIPDYFEVYRVEALLAAKLGDISRAHSCYEAALELANRQPQLHLFFAGFLYRSMDDYEGAAEQVDMAAKLDPSSLEIMFEAIRLAFFSYRFEDAKNLLARVSAMKFGNRRERVIQADLTTQLHSREADCLHRRGDREGCMKSLKELLDWLIRVDRTLVDSKHLDHIRKNYRLLYELERSPQFFDSRVVGLVLEVIRSIDVGYQLSPRGR